MTDRMPRDLKAHARSDRRSGRDRRHADAGPPSGRDRRVSVEPRQPEVREMEVTVEEWAALQAQAAWHEPAA